MSDIDVHVVAADNKALTSYITGTVKAYANLAQRLHISACMAVYHALEYRECSALNVLYKGMRVNDQTALRLWIAKHTMCPGDTDRNPNEKPMTFIGYTKEKGLFIRKGLKSEGAWLLDDLLSLAPFFDKNVQDKDALDLVKLLKALKAAAKRADKMAEDNDLSLPAGVETLIKELVSECDHGIAANANEDGHSNLEDAA